MQQLNGQYENCSYKPLTRLISRICIWWCPWIGSVYAFQYSLTHITKKKNRIEKDEKTKKPNGNKTKLNQNTERIKCFLLTVTNFILSSVSFIVWFFFYIFRARGFILHYFTFLPSSRNFPGIFYYYLLAFFKVVLCVFSCMVFQLGVKFRMPFRACLSQFHLYTIESDLFCRNWCGRSLCHSYHLLLSFLVFVFFNFYGPDMCAFFRTTPP